MTDSPESGGNSTIIKLRKFQLLLKREDNLNTYYDNEIERIPITMEKEYENFLHMNKILLAYHMYSINNAGLTLKPSVFESLRANPQDSERRPSQIKYNKQATERYKDFFLYFHNEIPNFSTVCIKLAKERKELIDILTFSVIPGFFAFLSTKMKIDQFLAFIMNVFKYDETIGCKFCRFIFVLPDFRVFFAKIIEKLKIPLHTLTNADVSNFVTDFCNCFKKYIDLCPNIVKKVMEFSKDQNNFIKESFLIPAFTLLRQFRLIPYDATIAGDLKDQLKNAILNKSNQIVQIINEASSSTSLACVGDISDISPYIDNTFLFTYYDLICINQMTDVTFADGSHIDKISNTTFSEPTDYSIFVFKYCFNEKIIPSESVQLSSLDELEYNLRTLLKHVNIIPLGAEGNTIEDVIDKQTLLVSADKRFRLKLKVEILKKSMERVIDDGNTYNFEELIDFMKQKFDERDAERKEEVVRISSMSTKIKNVKNMKDRLDVMQKVPLLNAFQYQLVEKWSRENNPTSLINETIYESPDQFARSFGTIADNFNSWLVSNGFQKISDYSIIHNFVMSAIPLDLFLKYRKDLQDADRIFYTKVRDRKDELLENVCENWMKPLLSNEKLVEPLLNTIGAFYSAKTPIEKVIQINKLRKKADQITTREGINEIGADQQLPIVLMTMILSQPKHYMSNLEYIDYFYSSTYKIYPILITDQQTDYSISLMKSLPEHKMFKDNLDEKPDA